MEDLAREPFVRLARGFLSARECDHLRALVEPRVPFSRGVNIPLESEREAGDKGGEGEAHAANFFEGGADDPVRTAHGHEVPRRYDGVVAGVEARAARLAGLPESHGEPMQVWRYDVGQRWSAHHDCVPRNEDVMAQWRELGGQRTVTVLLYLGEPEGGGGETVFPERQDWADPARAWADGEYSECARKGVAAKPRRGDALVFLNANEDPASPVLMGNQLAVHEACPVLGGTKWVAAKWYREMPHKTACWEAGAKGGEPESARLRGAARKLGSQRQRCHMSDLGKPLAPRLDMNASVPVELRIPFEDLTFKRRLGRGAMGEVVLAHWRGRDVAAKVIRPEFSSSAAAVDDFQQEARILAPLRHPNVVRLLGASTVAPDLCLVMELAAHGSLMAVLYAAQEENKGDGVVDLAQRLEWARDVARGLSYIHSQKPAVIHRDLKPQQILIDGDQRAKLADFGLAATVDEIAAEHEKFPMGIGTHEYMAPEVLQGGPCTTSSDTFSFGSTLFHVLSGEAPFSNSEWVLSSLIAHVVERGERPHSERPLPGPPELLQVMRDCWAQEPGERPTMAQVVERLEGIQLGAGAAPPEEG